MAGVAGAAEPLPAPQVERARSTPKAEGRQAPPITEGRNANYALKAGYLYKFTPFVDWPATAFEAPSSPFRLCIAGHDPFGGVVDHAARGARVGEHPVIVVRLPAVARSPDCHMLFLAASRGQTPQQVMAMVAGQPVLTVADEGLEAPGAVIQFVMIDSRLRFEIRADAAQAAGLTVSSKLLALAAQPKESGR
ncbi:hypothetical protein CSW62_06925 [Caulobacter sp. FWC2]|nr:hypothetical protein CSW62_06925 [Caulobacter sp. FWC2]